VSAEAAYRAGRRVKLVLGSSMIGCIAVMILWEREMDVAVHRGTLNIRHMRHRSEGRPRERALGELDACVGEFQSKG
jgi:hypothetical protein